MLKRFTVVFIIILLLLVTWIMVGISVQASPALNNGLIQSVLPGSDSSTSERDALQLSNHAVINLTPDPAFWKTVWKMLKGL